MASLQTNKPSASLEEILAAANAKEMDNKRPIDMLEVPEINILEAMAIEDLLSLLKTICGAKT